MTMSTKIKVRADELRPGDRTTGYEIAGVIRPATEEEIAELWGDTPHPKIVAARVRWVDGGESYRFWASDQPIEITREVKA